ncbi:MAG: DNA mismatch endonuclease Vsr [Planctomycetia bacterium]|nr:MAG: DNA mismatch endonuclease Vsr [Planctomycetia bacterium]
MDRITEERRRWNMSRIRGRDTGPEKVVRSLLHRMGCRFRLYRRDLPGCPDIVLPKHRSVVFVHGCFWHRHARCRFSYTPKSRVGFWSAKFAENVRRDTRVRRALRNLGWRVIIVWECQTANPQVLVTKLARAFEQKERSRAGTHPVVGEKRRSCCCRAMAAADRQNHRSGVSF